MQNEKYYGSVVNKWFQHTDYNVCQVLLCFCPSFFLFLHNPVALYLRKSFIQTLFTQGGPMRVVNAPLHGQTVYRVHKSRDTVSHPVIINKTHKAAIEIWEIEY